MPPLPPLKETLRMCVESQKFFYISLVSTVVIGFEDVLYVVDESAGTVNISVVVMEGVDVLTAGVVSEVVVVLSTQDDSAVG